MMDSVQFFCALRKHQLLPNGTLMSTASARYSERQNIQCQNIKFCRVATIGKHK